jgi:hypothetical protein
LLSEGIQVLVDEGSQEALLALPVTSASAAPAVETNRAFPAASTPSSYYYAWVNVDEVAVSGTAQVQVGNLRLEPESLNWWRSDDLAHPSQLMSPYNWTPQFGAAGVAATAGASTCKQPRGTFKVARARVYPNNGQSPLKTMLTVNVRGGKRPYTYTWYFADGSYYTRRSCSQTERVVHDYYNIGPPDALYAPQIQVTDNGGSISQARNSLKVLVQRGGTVTVSPRFANLPIVLIGGIGTRADNADYARIAEILQGMGWQVHIVDWAPRVEVYDLNQVPQSIRHMPYLAVMETQRQIVEKIGASQRFIAVGLSGGGLIMRFLLEHPRADVIDPTQDVLHNEGWAANRTTPWYGDGRPDVAPCDRNRNANECGGIGPSLAKPWAERVEVLYTLGSPNNGTPASSQENCAKLTGVAFPKVPVLPALAPQWQVSCNDLSLDAAFIRAMGNMKPTVSAGVEYIVGGSDATDGLRYHMFPIPLYEIWIDPKAWNFYPYSTAGDFGFDGIVPTESPWVYGAKHFILWDGDDPVNNGGEALPKDTSLHHKCLVANLWLWNRVFDHLAGRFDFRSDDAVYGQLIYSGESVISGGEFGEPMYTCPRP